MEMEKRLKRSSVDEMDRISELPESVLLHILSLLDMKDVVRTSLLSKKWEYIWTSVPTLTFKFYSQEEKLRPFIMWINKTLFQCQNNTGRKFHVKFPYMKEFAGDIDLWAKFVARNNIQDVTLDVSGTCDSYKLPRSLCQNSSLSSLSISRCTMDHGAYICWTSLRSLSIAFMSLDDDIMTKIFSGSPMLQVLKLYRCDSRKVLHINSISLRELVIEYFITPMLRTLVEISAPNIQSLHILGQLFLGNIHLCSSSLFRAKLDFQFLSFDSEKEYCRSKFMTVMESIRPVVQLEVGCDFLDTLACLGKKSLSLPLSNLTCLKLNGVMDKTDIVGIICLLKCSPNLEKLVLNKKHTFYIKHHYRNESLVNVADEYWRSEKLMEKFELPYLKTVKFNWFREVDEFTRILLKILRQNAVHLDNIVIDLGDLPMIIMPKPRVA